VPVEYLLSSQWLSFEVLDADSTACDPPPSSLLDVQVCVRDGSRCAVEEALATAVPRASDLLSLLFDVAASGLCLPPPTGNTDGLGRTPPARAALRCQKVVASASRRLLTRQLAVARKCVDSLFACRLAGRDAAGCQRVASRCGTKLAALADPARGAHATLVGAVEKACAGLPPAALLSATGIGFESITARCADLSVPAMVDVHDVAQCVGRAYACAGSAVVRHALPLIDGELARVGLRLSDDAFCAPPSPTPTASGTPSATVTPAPSETAGANPTPTPEATATPEASATTTPTSSVLPTPTPEATSTVTPEPTATPAPACGDGLLEDGEVCDDGNTVSGDGCDANCTPTGCGNGIPTGGEVCDDGNAVDGDGCRADCVVERLVPGGGSLVTDCVTEWAVDPDLAPIPEPGTPPGFRLSCVDGDACDADAATDGRCTFRVAVCLDVGDPSLPDCAVPGLAKYTLQSPRPDSTDDTDRANAEALLEAFQKLGPVERTGTSLNGYVFAPSIAAGRWGFVRVRCMLHPVGGVACHQSWMSWRRKR